MSAALPDALAAFQDLVRREDPERVFRKTASRDPDRDLSFLIESCIWLVSGNERAQIQIVRLTNGRITFAFAGGFTPRVDQLPILRRIDDATDGYLFSALERTSPCGAAFLREMIHRDRIPENREPERSHPNG